MAEYNKFSTPPGLNHVGSYQVSGIPYLTGSASLAANLEDQIKFPMVTNNFTVINTGDTALRVTFASVANAAVELKMHYIELSDKKDSVTFNVKCKEVYVSNVDGSSAGSYSLMAELTQIPTARMYALSGSGINENSA
tara:strand:- start:125 stop:538 length:414 start_codon:yes stop_codon:yes gene_type:complete